MSKIYIATDSSPVDIQSYELCSDMIDVVLDVSSIYGQPTHNSTPPSTSPSLNPSTLSSKPLSPSSNASGLLSPVSQASSGASSNGAGGGGNSEMNEAHAVIKLNNGMVLYLREVNK
jgi:Ras-related GTP-binding protein C/D